MQGTRFDLRVQERVVPESPTLNESQRMNRSGFTEKERMCQTEKNTVKKGAYHICGAAPSQVREGKRGMLKEMK